MVGSSSSISGVPWARARRSTALSLPSGQLVHRSVCEVDDLGGLEGGGHGRLVGSGELAEPALVWVAAAADGVGDGDPLGGDRLLGEHAEAAGDLSGREPVDVGAVEQDVPAARFEQPGEAVEQGRLSAGVGTDDDRDALGGNGERQAVDDEAVVISEADASAINE